MLNSMWRADVGDEHSRSDKKAGKYGNADAQHRPVSVEAAVGVDGTNGPDGGKR
jgi:hypothetical protein